jgi:hypothetical protein
VQDDPAQGLCEATAKGNGITAAVALLKVF